MDKRVQQYVIRKASERTNQEPYEFGYEQEMELSHVIEGGRVDMLSGIINKNRPSYRKTEPKIRLSDDPVQNDIYKFVNALALFTRAAIKGGIPERIAYDLKESYTYCADKYRTTYFKDALITYTETVAEYKGGYEKYGATVQNIKRYIYEHISNDIHIRDIAEALYLSQSHCSHVFKKAEGITIHQFIENARIEIACSMLTYTTFTIQDISERVGFSRQSYFTEVFHKHMGITPTEYRNRAREEGDEILE